MPHQPHQPHQAHQPRRRTWLLGALGLGLAGAAATLPACGFQLRQPRRLSLGRVALLGFDADSPMAAALHRAIEAGGSPVVESAAEADVVLRALLDVREQLVASTTGAGQVRTITVRTRLRFRLITSDELRVLLPETELALARDLSFDEKWALGKQQEVEQIYRVMRDDIVDQVMQRLAAVSAAGTAAGAPSASAVASAAASAAAAR